MYLSIIYIYIYICIYITIYIYIRRLHGRPAAVPVPGAEPDDAAAVVTMCVFCIMCIAKHV